MAVLPERLGVLEAELAQLGGPQPLDAICADFFAAGGKRLRAMAAMTVAEALGLRPEVGTALAVAVESTHGASLLHDDVIDESDERRGRPAARRRWCNTLSVLGGDYLLLAGLRAVLQLECSALLDAHLATLEAVLAAEVRQHRAKECWEMSTRGYLEIARGKTGALFAQSCASPAIVAGDAPRAQALSSFGMELGVAFQIADDIRDVLGLDPGKPTGLDFVDGVLSLPLRIAARRDPDVRAGLEQASRSGLAPRELKALLDRVRTSGALERAGVIGADHLARASATLATVGLGRELAPLGAVCRWLEQELASFRELAA
jgi:heptaprenyl diphosphate synthase